MTIIVIEKPEGAIKMKFPLKYLPVFSEDQYMKQYEVFNTSDWRFGLSKYRLKKFFSAFKRMVLSPTCLHALKWGENPSNAGLAKKIFRGKENYIGRRGRNR